MGARFDDTPVARPTVNAHVEEAADEQAEQERDKGFDHRVTRPSMTRMDGISPIGRFSPPPSAIRDTMSANVPPSDPPGRYSRRGWYPSRRARRHFRGRQLAAHRP